jgi:hypothetical protein
MPATRWRQTQTKPSARWTGYARISPSYRKREAETRRKAEISAVSALADQIREAMESHLGEGAAQVSAVYPANYMHRPARARSLPAVTIEMDLQEAQAVAALLGSMRKK